MAKFNQPDPRNEGTWCWVNGLVRREDAKVSVLDSVVQGGDAVWEGLRVADGRIQRHLFDVLRRAARAPDLVGGFDESSGSAAK